jgi:hypothetical protein
MKSYGKLTAGIIAVWFLFALSASAMGLFTNNANRIGVSVALAAGIPILLFFWWLAASPGIRQFALSLNPVTLTLAHSMRIVGITFVVLEARDVLPAVFAWPAGYGDIFMGVTATFAAWKLAHPGRRGSFILWQFLGIADLVTAVALGTTAGLLSPDGPSMLPMTVLPLSLIPTFIVPLLLMLHVIAIAQARTWKRSAFASSQPSPTQALVA